MILRLEKKPKLFHWLHLDWPCSSVALGASCQRVRHAQQVLRRALDWEARERLPEVVELRPHASRGIRGIAGWSGRRPGKSGKAGRGQDLAGTYMVSTNSNVYKGCSPRFNRSQIFRGLLVMSLIFFLETIAWNLEFVTVLNNYQLYSKRYLFAAVL